MSRVVPALLSALLVLVACSGDDEEPVAAASPVEEPAESEEPGEEPEPEPEPEDTRPRSFLTGLPMDEDLVERPLLIAKIENSPQARPQTGLDAADVVYEEVVEGGVTRFFVLFHSELPDDAGPIRSARPVDTQLMAGYPRAGFAFSGARAEVQSMLANTPNVRITEGGAGFYRDGSRRAPHNLYIEPASTLQGVVDRGAEPLLDVGWEFDEEVPSGAVRCPAGSADCEDPGASIAIAMSNSFRTGWEYDAAEGVYRRFQNQSPFLVTGHGRIGAANVVVLSTRHYVGASGYPETDVVTDGARAVVLRDGKRYEARWTKTSATASLRLLNPDGTPFPLKPGSTWLHLAPPGALPAELD